MSYNYDCSKTYFLILLQIFSSAFIYQLTKSLLPIFVVPLFISSWGELEYSEWIQAMAIVSFISLLSLGLNNFSINRCQTAFKKNLASILKSKNEAINSLSQNYKNSFTKKFLLFVFIYFSIFQILF